MTAEIINLRQARKRAQRERKEVLAAENRSRYGQPKADRAVVEAELQEAIRHLDGHKLEGRSRDDDCA